MPVITLLSDLSTSNIAVSSARIILNTHVPDMPVIDVSHNVSPYNIQQAAYICRKAYHTFPAGSIHLLMIDIAKGERHRMLLARCKDHYFIAPDNGILSLTFGNELAEIWLCREFNTSVSIADWVAMAAHIISSSAYYSPDGSFIRFMINEVAQLSAPKPEGARLDCHIIYIDRYGNVVINFSKDQFDELIGDGPFSIQLPKERHISRLSNHVSDVIHGDLLCRFNNAGMMELAISHGSLASILEFDKSDKGMSYNVITIHF